MVITQSMIQRYEKALGMKPERVVIAQPQVDED